jgi:ribonuclease R
MPKARIYPYDEATLEKLGEQCSMTERRADEATRDVVNWLKCEFMQDRVGETFAGVITAVTGFGIFVELRDIYVDGLVHVTALPADYYHFDPVHHRLSGERSGRSFRLGDSVEVKVMRVDLDERKIDFELSQDKAGKGDDARRGGKPSGMGNTDVQKSRDVKKALLAGAKAGKGASGKGAAGKSASKPAGGARKGSGRGESAPPTAGKPRKRKAKS